MALIDSASVGKPEANKHPGRQLNHISPSYTKLIYGAKASEPGSYSHGQPLTFLDLPVEIRLLIYRFLLHRVRINLSETSSSKEPYHGVNILCASRQIYAEAVPILYGENQFWIKTDGDLFASDFAAINPSTRAMIRTLTVTNLLCHTEYRRKIINIGSQLSGLRSLFLFKFGFMRDGMWSWHVLRRACMVMSVFPQLTQALHAPTVRPQSIQDLRFTVPGVALMGNEQVTNITEQYQTVGTAKWEAAVERKKRKNQG